MRPLWSSSWRRGASTAAALPALQKVAEQYSDRLFIGQVDIDEEPALAQQEQIEVVPTFVLYRDGQALGSMTAPNSKAEIEAFLEEHLGK